MGTSPLAQLALILLVGVLCFLVGLGERGLWNPMEPRYAGISAGLARGEGWLIPRYWDDWYAHKPPLFFWTVASVLRFDPETRDLFLLRLPSALAAVLAMVGTWLLGRRLWNGRAGLIAALTLATCWMTTWSARFCHMDAPVTACVVWSMVALLGAVGSHGARRRWWIALAALALGTGLLIKGPLALVVPALSLVVTAALLRQSSLIRRAGLGWALLGSLVPFLLWVVPAWQLAGDAWAREILVGQAFSRHVGTAEPDRSHALYYLVKFWGAFGPWSLLVPFAILDAIRRARDEQDKQASVLAGTWFVGMVILLSFVDQRRDRYLLPLLPACALLLGRWLDGILTPSQMGGHAKRFQRGALLTLCCLLFVSSLLVGLSLLFPTSVLPDLLSEQRVISALTHLAGQGALPGVFGISLVLAAAWGLVLVFRRRAGWALAASVACFSLAASAWALVGAPAVDHVRGDARVLANLEPLLAENRHFAILGKWGLRESTQGYFHFLTGIRPRLFRHADGEFEKFARGGHAVILVRKKFLTLAPEVSLEDWTRRVAAPLGRDRLWIYTRD